LKTINGNQSFASEAVIQTAEISAASIGAWFIAKWRHRCAESGVQIAAAQMRKQGIPLEVALCVLSGVFA
jgi:hypothetical protein